MVTAALVFVALALLFPRTIRAALLFFGIVFIAGYAAKDAALEISRPAVTAWQQPR